MTRVPTLFGPVGLGTVAVEKEISAACIAAVGAVLPLPLIGTCCGLSALLSVMMMSALYGDAALGLNVTVIVQEPPAATLPPQVFIWEKAAAPVPVMVMLVMVSVFVPVFVSVVAAELVVPTFTRPRPKMSGINFTVPFTVPFAEPPPQPKLLTAMTPESSIPKSDMRFFDFMTASSRPQLESRGGPGCSGFFAWKAPVGQPRAYIFSASRIYRAKSFIGLDLFLCPVNNGGAILRSQGQVTQPVKEVAPSHGVIRFSAFEVDLRNAEVRKHGFKIRLQDQPFHVLQILLEHPGELVTREELQRQIWPADTFVDFEKGLNNAIKRLRDALGDSAEQPRFIETHSRRGYRFMGSVEELGNGARMSAGPPATVTVDSIAVLPFTSMSANPEDEFFADGITEEIINALAQIEQLRVVARTSAFSFKGKYIDVRAVGKRLNVRTILLGSVRRDGNELRITAQLINVEDGYHLWSDRYDREVKDIFEIQDEIARAIAERLKVTLKGGEQDRLLKAATNNLEVYQLYVKGRALLYRRGGAISRAAECFEREVALDPDYALAWAGFADSHTVLGYYGLGRPETNMPKALEAARRAVALAPSLAEGHNALAMASLMGAWDRATGEREFLRALELNPGYVQARAWYAIFYLQFSEGRLAQGVAQAKLALVSDPLSSYAHAIYGLTCGCAGRHAEAVEAARRAVALDSESYLAHMCLQAVLHFSGQLEESVAANELALAMSGRHPWAMATLAATFADWGKTADADAVYAEMLARARHQYVPPAPLACAAAAAARGNEAIRHAREAFAIRDPECLMFFSPHFPYSARLYVYPRFCEIVASMGRSDWLRD